MYITCVLFVQRFEPQDRHFRNIHYCHYYLEDKWNWLQLKIINTVFIIFGATQATKRARSCILRSSGAYLFGVPPGFITVAVLSLLIVTGTSGAVTKVTSY